MSAIESDSEDPLAPPRSPGLKAVKVRFRPSPSPPPFSQKQEVISPISSRIKKSAKRKKPRPSQGDVVLLNFMSNYNQPQVAAEAGKATLEFESGGESDGASDDTGEDLDSKIALEMEAEEKAKNLPQTAQKAMSLLDTSGSSSKQPIDLRRDSTGVGKTSDDDGSPTKGLQGLKLNGIPERTMSQSTDDSLISPTNLRKTSLPQSYAPEESLVTSPLSAHLKDPDSPGRKLPALQHGSPQDAGSPQTTKLPSVVGLFEIADQVNETADALRRRQSSFSVSPTLQFSASSARSPAAFPPGSHTSPTLTQSDSTSPRDYRSPHSYFLPPRRTSAASETSPSGLHPAVASASASSTDGTSPSTQPTPLSTDGSVPTTIILPLPVPSMAGTGNLVSASSASSSAVPGSGYRCDHPGCGAQPFQTQYLLKYVFSLI